MSRSIRTFIIAAFAACLSHHCTAQLIDSQQAMHQRVMTLYDFHPRTVTDAVRAEKSQQMDAFWSEVKDHKESDLPFLRSELANPQAPPFFRMDGAQLLLSLSSSP